MSDYSINPISIVRPAEAGAVPSRAEPVGPAYGNASRPNAQGGTEAEPLKLGPAAQADLSNARPSSTLPDSPAAKLAAQTDKAPQGKADARPTLPITNGGNVTIRFRVDSQTNQVTVFVVDRVSKRVLRSIPPEEVGKLLAGDLIELTG